MLEAIETLGAIAGRRLELVRHAPSRGRCARERLRTRRGSASELGWAPTTSFEDGLAAQWRWAADRVATA